MERETEKKEICHS